MLTMRRPAWIERNSPTSVCLRAEEHPDDQNVDLNPAHDLERLERILGCQDTVAGRTQRLIDQFLDGCVLLEHEDRRGTRCSHAAIVVRRRLTTLDPDGSVGRS